MAYIFSIHIPTAGLSPLPLLADWPLVLFLAHIAFLEMVIDPACSLTFESEAAEKDVMDRPPRAVQELLFSRWTFLASLHGSNRPDF